MIAIPRKLKRADASPDVLRAVNRWRLAVPHGEPHDVDRAVIATLLSFGRELDHDTAIAGALVLSSRLDQMLRKLLCTCRLNTDLATVHRLVGQLDELRRDLQGIHCPRIEKPVKAAVAERINDGRTSKDPTPEEIAAACAAIRRRRQRIEVAI